MRLSTAAIHLAAPVASWTDCDCIVWRLTSRYAEVLDILVSGQPADYLVWSGLDVPGQSGRNTVPRSTWSDQPAGQ